MAQPNPNQPKIKRTVDEWLAEAAAHEEAGRLEEAEAILMQVIEAEPSYPPALSQAAVLSFKRKRPQDSINRLQRAIRLAPDVAVFHRNLCEIYRGQSRLDEALVHGKRAVELTPDDSGAHYNLSVLHYDRLETDEAIAHARRALELDPGSASAHFELAEGLLVTGRFEEGWKEYEYRFSLPNAPALLPPHDKPLWDGKPMPDGTLMLIGDQGFGDSIQFCRYIPEVAKLCPNLTMACSSEMRPIIIQQPGITKYFDRWEHMPDFDAYCPLSGLPRLFGTNLTNIPAPVPYVKADPEKVEHWRQRLDVLVPSGYRRIGIVWAGRPTHGNDYNRSMTLAKLAPLAKLDRVALVSVQKGPAQAEIGGYFGAAPLINLGAEIRDFTDTMAILELIERLVACDTSVAHLAGAMGKPVSVLLPYAPDWRWLLKRSDTPWYPDMRFFRQTKPGSWTEPVTAVAEGLAR